MKPQYVRKQAPTTKAIAPLHLLCKAGSLSGGHYGPIRLVLHSFFGQHIELTLLAEQCPTLKSEGCEAVPDTPYVFVSVL